MEIRIKVTITAILLVCCASLSAEEVSLSQAKTIAERFMASKGKTSSFTYEAKSRSARTSASSANGSNAEAANEPSNIFNAQAANEPYYIFNAEAANGFVIVAGDNTFGDILGYSNEGSIDIANAPEGLKALLHSYEILMASAKAGTSVTTAKRVAGTPIVAPLLGNINWGQDAPFNNYCPTYTSGGLTKNYYVGCVATAMSQIMKYHAYPNQGIGIKTYTSNVGDMTAYFGGSTYDWSKMCDFYNVTSTEEEEAEVARLCSQVAVSVEMTWAEDGSGAFSQFVEGALENYFGYDRSASYIIRDYYTTDKWMKILKTELDAKRPVFYSASNEDGLGGHAFVADGYDSADYIHINWGWYGKSNGYFLVNALNPYDLGIGANGGGYNLHQEMVVGIQPDKSQNNGLPALYSPTRMTGGNYGSIYLMCYVENNSVNDFYGKVSAVLVKDGSIVKVLKTDDLSLAAASQNGKLVLDSKLVKVEDIPATANDVADGDYELRYAVAEDGGKMTILKHTIGLPAYLEARVANGNISVTTHEMKPEATLLSKIEADGDVYSNSTASLTLTIQNNSKEMNLGKIRLALTPAGGTEATCVLKDKSDVFNIYNQSTKTLTMLTTLPALEPGEYTVKAYEEKYDKYPFDDTAIGTTTLTVLAEPATPVVRATSTVAWSATDGSITLRQDDILAASIQTRNYGAAGKANVLMKLKDAEGNEHPFMMVNATMSKGEQKSIVFQRRLDLDPGTYQFIPYYITEDSIEHRVENSDNLETITVKENPSLSLYCEELNIPREMIKGEKYSCSITIKALKAVTSKTIYIRLRQFTNTQGEIVYMKSGVTMKAGETLTIPFNYRPAINYADYMPIVESKVGTNQYETMGGFKNYGKVYYICSTPTIYGDANNDGSVTVADVSAIASYILGNAPENFNLRAADGNQDSRISVADISYAVQCILSGEQ